MDEGGTGSGKGGAWLMAGCGSFKP